MKIAYDIGMNNGDDTDYLIKKGYKVVAIEANSVLCNQCRIRFSNQIDKGILKILNIGVGDTEGILDFYLDNHSHTTSTFVPQPNQHNRYTLIKIPVSKLSNIIKENGSPYLLKIDIEGFDYRVLKEVFSENIIPPYVSSEAHSVDILCH